MSISPQVHLPSLRLRLERAIYTSSAGAFFSDDRRYRYVLWRRWNIDGPVMMFVGLNPSTANEKFDDPTIRRCIGFARAHGAAGVIVSNLFAFQATKPRDLFAEPEPVGSDADAWLGAAAEVASSTIACWGAHGCHQDRASEVLHVLRDPLCFGVTLHGEPRHPLYLRGDSQLVPLSIARSGG